MDCHHWHMSKSGDPRRHPRWCQRLARGSHITATVMTLTSSPYCWPRHGDPLSRRQRLSSVADAVAKAGRGRIGELTQPEISTTTEDKRIPDLRLRADPRVSVSVEEARQSKDERDAVNDDTRLGCTHRHHGNRNEER